MPLSKHISLSAVFIVTELLALSAVGLLLGYHLEHSARRAEAISLYPATAHPTILFETNPETVQANVGTAVNQGFVLDTQGTKLATIQAHIGYPGSLLSITNVSSSDSVCEHSLVVERISGEVTLSCRLSQPAHQSQLLSVFTITTLPLAPGSAMMRLLPSGSSATDSNGNLLSLRAENGVITIH